MKALFPKSIVCLSLCLLLSCDFTPAKAQENPLPPQPTETSLRVALEKAEADKLATKPNTKERGDAAQKEMGIVTDLAWIAFDSGKYAEAATWFERNSQLKREANAAQKAHWENVLATEVPPSEAGLNKRIEEWKAELKTTTDPEKQKTLRSLIKGFTNNRWTVRYGTISMLQTLARDANDNLEWLKQQQEELRIRREELTDLTNVEGTATETDKKKAEIAKALERVAWAQQESGLLKEAEKNILDALAMRKALPETLPERDLGEALEALASLYFNSLGDLKKAREYYEAALAENDKSLTLQLKQHETDPYPAEIKATMTPEALKEHETRRADLKQMMLASAAMGKVKILTNLAYVAHETGDLRGANEMVERGFNVTVSLPDEKSMWYELARAVVRSRALLSRSSIRIDSGDMEGALKDLDETIAIRRQMGNTIGTADALQQAGRLLYDQEKFAQAKPYAEQARRIFASEQNLNGVLSATGTLALIARGSGDLPEAEARADEALTLARKLGLETNVAWAARVLASIRLKQNRLSEAEALLNEAAPIAQRGVSVSDKVFTNSLQGQLLEAQKKNAEAIEKYRAAVLLIEGVRATASSETAFADVKANYEIYERLVKLLIKSGQGEAAFEYLGRAKSKKLQDTLTLSSIKTNDATLRSKLDDANSLDARLHAIIAQLESELAKPATEQNAARIDNLQNIKAQTQDEFFKVLNGLTTAKRTIEVNVKPADLKAGQRRLPADTAVIQYAPIGDELYVFVFTRTSLKVIVAPAKPEAVWTLIRDVRPQLARGNDTVRGMRLVGGQTSSTKAATASLETNLTALYDALIAPIEADLADKTTLAFIPTQWLYYLPMQALAKKQGDRLRYLVEDKNVVYMATSGQFTNAIAPIATDELGTGLFAFGDPVGAELPAAREEVQTLGRIYPDSNILSGAGVSKTAVLDQTNLDRRILHFATHGILDRTDPNQSYLQLSPGTTPEDGRLTVSEIRGMNLRKVEVVTLSACQTALGQGDPGTEVMTLAGAFDDAGALSVVASLWSVSDDSTKELMVEFYRELAAGKNKAQALRAAQLKVRANSQFSHPFYWAPFILMGSWQ